MGVSPIRKPLIQERVAQKKFAVGIVYDKSLVLQ